MKQIKYLLMAFIALFTCISFSACSDDDDEGGGSSKMAALSPLWMDVPLSTSIFM